MRTSAALFCPHSTRAGKPFSLTTPTQSNRSLTSAGLSDHHSDGPRLRFPALRSALRWSWRGKVGFPHITLSGLRARTRDLFALALCDSRIGRPFASAQIVGQL
jgi:hypothetical protein